MDNQLINAFILLGSLLVLVNSTSINHTLTAKMSSSKGNIKVVSYNFVEGVKDEKDILLIDVREPSELAETGIIPGSINIPLAEVENALKNLSSEEFFNRYGRQKPSKNFPLVFSCRSGKRSEAASTIAQKLGYNNINNYSGGWLDWEQKNKNKTH